MSKKEKDFIDQLMNDEINNFLPFDNNYLDTILHSKEDTSIEVLIDLKNDLQDQLNNSLYLSLNNAFEDRKDLYRTYIKKIEVLMFNFKPKIILDVKPSILETRKVWGLFIAIQQKVGILPKNKKIIATQFAPILGFEIDNFQQAITSEKDYRTHKYSIDDLEEIEDAVNSLSKEIDRLKNSNL